MEEAWQLKRPVLNGDWLVSTGLHDRGLAGVRELTVSGPVDQVKSGTQLSIQIE